MSQVEAAGLVLPDVDLTKDVPCQWLGGCGRTATWAQVNQCCGLACSLCDEHKRKTDQTLARLRAGGGYDCRRCDAFNSDYERRPL